MARMAWRMVRSMVSPPIASKDMVSRDTVNRDTVSRNRTAWTHEGTNAVRAFRIRRACGATISRHLQTMALAMAARTCQVSGAVRRLTGAVAGKYSIHEIVQIRPVPRNGTGRAFTSFSVRTNGSNTEWVG